MLNRYFPCLLGLAASMAFGAASYAQDAQPSAPAALSANQLMDEELAAPEGIQIDPALLAIPENATADELFEFVESLQEKLPQPQSQEDLYKLVDAFSKTGLAVADKLLAMEDLTAEQRERAVQLKVVSLTTRANVDKEASGELEAFVEDNLKSAKTDEELIKAYQLKLQVLAASEDDPLAKIDALAEEALQREQEELQIFAIEVKANSFLSAVQKSGEFDKNILTFVDGIVADEKRAPKVKEKALEMKLVALIVAAEIEKSKEADEQTTEYADQAEALFAQLLDGDYTLDLKKTVYQLRVQTLMDAGEVDQAKVDAIVEKLSKEEDSELYALGVAVKGQTLLNAANDGDPDAVKAVAEYADKIVEEAKTRPELQTQSIGLKIQSYRLQNDDAGLLAYVDEELAKNPSDELKNNLYLVKVRVVRNAIAKDPASFDSFKAFLDEAKDMPELADGVAQIYSARFNAAVSKIAEDGGDLVAYNAALDQFKAGLESAPRSITALLMARQAIDQIGDANKNNHLFDETFDAVIDFCKASDVEDLNSLAQQLEIYLMQMRQAEEQAKEQQAAELKAAAEAAAAEKEAPKAEEKTEAPKAEAAKAAPVKKAEVKPATKAAAAKPAAKPAAKTTDAKKAAPATKAQPKAAATKPAAKTTKK